MRVYQLVGRPRPVSAVPLLGKSQSPKCRIKADYQRRRRQKSLHELSFTRLKGSGSELSTHSHHGSTAGQPS